MFNTSDLKQAPSRLVTSVKNDIKRRQRARRWAHIKSVATDHAMAVIIVIAGGALLTALGYIVLLTGLVLQAHYH